MSPKDWRQAIVSATTPISEALKVIDDVSLQICLVVDDHDCLIGAVTDGDVRRGLLRSIPLDGAVSEIMAKSPIMGRIGESLEHWLEVMTKRDVRQLPIVDGSGRIVDLVLRDDLLMPTERPNWVVLMAGGLGTRLRPLTEETPKPLLNVGGKPILESILESLIEHRFEKFYVSVNYKAEMIKSHFGRGERWGVQIRYLEEPEQLGTAGALGLIEETHDQPLIVMNGDIVTRVNYGQLLEFHSAHGAAATMCVREYDLKVPFGVVTLDDNCIRSIVEKPVHSFFVNAGIYVINPDLLSMVYANQRLDMPELFERVLAQKKTTVAFPIREYWIDIGRNNDFDQANGDFQAFSIR